MDAARRGFDGEKAYTNTTGLAYRRRGEREREKKAYKYIQTEEGDFESIRLCREPGPTRREKMCLLENDL